MVSSSKVTSTAGKADCASCKDYFEERRDNVDAFVARHFTWPGTLHLHGAALGWDILRAPVNVLLSPVFVLIRISAYFSRRLGWRGGADWLAGRRILLRTAVAGRVEASIVTDLLELPLPAGDASRDPDALSRAVLAAPQFREMIRKREDAADAAALAQRITDALGEYAGTRSAVAEMATTCCALLAGALIFQTLTPGMISMAPGIADALVHAVAIADFPLGQIVGGLWYGLFPTNASPWQVTATVAGLVMIGSVGAAFAGVLADPVQSWLGIHRRRLLRLVDTLEVELAGTGSRPFAAREHFYARLLDVLDAGASVFRIFRN